MPNGSISSFQHVILEHQLSQAIIQVALGKFVRTDGAGSAGLQIAVLHPRELAVYEISGRGNTQVSKRAQCLIILDSRSNTFLFA